jgi:phage terminase small subunit
MSKRLTPRRAAFVREFLKNPNGAEAARRAGYAPKSADVEADRLLGIAEVKAAIAAGQAQKAKRYAVEADTVLRRLAEYAEANPDAEEFETAEDGTQRRKPSTLKHEHVLRALELLGKHLSLFTEKVEMSGEGGGPLVVEIRKYTGEDE